MGLHLAAAIYNPVNWQRFDKSLLSLQHELYKMIVYIKYIPWNLAQNKLRKITQKAQPF